MLLHLFFLCALSEQILFNGNYLDYQQCTTLSGDFQFCWSSDIIDQTISMAIRRKTTGYVAVGFSLGGSMVGSNAIVGWKSIDSSYKYVGDYYLASQTIAGVTIKGNLQLLSADVDIDSNGYTTVIFTRNLTVATLPINHNGSNYLIWASGALPGENSTSLSLHNIVGSGSVNFATGTVTDSTNSYVKTHATMMAFGWCFFIFMGVLIARFHKKNGNWFMLHRGLNLTGLLFIVIAWFIGVMKLGNGTQKIHFAVGTTAVVLGLVQPMFAAIRPAFPRPGERVSTLRFIWNQQHHWIGRSALLLAVINMFIGLYIAKPGLTAVWTFTGGLLLWFAIFIYFQWMAYNVPKPDEVPLNSDRPELSSEIATLRKEDRL